MKLTELITDGIHNALWDHPDPPKSQYGAMAEAILAALSAAGYVVVPKEPTEAMMDRVMDAAPYDGGGVTHVEAYRAMISEAEDEP